MKEIGIAVTDGRENYAGEALDIISLSEMLGQDALRYDRLLDAEEEINEL